jgi:uncharacterized membrane protein YfcA
MSPSVALALLAMGICVGLISGMMGIGGAIIVIPLLIMLFGLSQKQATGTCLAMLLPPIGLFATLVYARSGNVNWAYAGLLAAGFAVGGWLGARLVNTGWISPTTMRISFALLLIYIAANLLFRPGGRARAAFETSIMVAGFAIAYAVMRLLGRRWMRQPSWPEVYRSRVRHDAPDEYQI